MGRYVSLKTLKAELNKKSRRRSRVVFTNGCFDILHAGHVRYLKKARSMGEILVVGLNSDLSAKGLKKGPGRPFVPERERAEVLAALEAVDYVVLFNAPTPIELIKALRPGVLVKGADWKKGKIVGEDFVKASGGSVRRVRLVKGRSTTNIVKKVVRAHKK